MIKKMMLTKQEVCRLYDEGEKTLAEIGLLAGVTRARISQLMNQWGHPRRRRGPSRNDKFTDLDSYLEYCEETGRQTQSVLLRLLKPYLKRCENCGAIRRLRFKYRRWPVTSLRDVRVLCSACLYAPTRGKGLDGLKRREIYSRHSCGERVDSLAEEFEVTPGRIYQIIWAEREPDERPKDASPGEL